MTSKPHVAHTFVLFTFSNRFFHKELNYLSADVSVSDQSFGTEWENWIKTQWVFVCSSTWLLKHNTSNFGTKTTSNRMKITFQAMLGCSGQQNTRSLKSIFVKKLIKFQQLFAHCLNFDQIVDLRMRKFCLLNESLDLCAGLRRSADGSAISRSIRFESLQAETKPQWLFFYVIALSYSKQITTLVGSKTSR